MQDVYVKGNDGWMRGTLGKEMLPKNSLGLVTKKKTHRNGTFKQIDFGGHGIIIR